MIPPPRFRGMRSDGGSGIESELSRPVSPEALANARETRDWYEGRQSGLGAVFHTTLDETIAKVAERPLMFPCVHGKTRAILIPIVFFDGASEKVDVIREKFPAAHHTTWDGLPAVLSQVASAGGLE